MYKGNEASIPLGQLGLRTDDPMTSLPPNAAITANNVRMFNSTLMKAPGSAHYNSTALSAPIIAAFDWWPNASTQRAIALTSDGKVWRDTGDGTFGSSTPIATGLLNLTPQTTTLVSGGAETPANNRKLFIFSQGNQVQRISGDGVTIAPISNPPADWSNGNFPITGCIFSNRLVGASGHNIYFSKSSNHEDFTVGTGSDAALFQVFPGEGDAIHALSVYKGRLFIFKKPYGVYYLEDLGVSSTTTGTDPAGNFAVRKLTDSFGIASSHAIIQPLDDLVAGNVANSITSLQATQAFGDVKSGDILSINQVEYYYKSLFSPAGIPYMQAIYYAEKKQAIFTGRTSTSSKQNLMLIMDVARSNPRMFVETKDQPTCLFLRKDSSGIPRPAYGADDGFLYLMESPSYNVAGQAYTGEFQTPFMDFSYMDEKLSAKNKIFDFLEIQYQATGNYSFYVDVYVDNRFIETVTYNQFAGSALDSFVLDRDKLAVQYTQNSRKPLHATGKRISFRIYNNNSNQYFQVEKLIVSFRVSGEQQKPISGVYSV